jgi:hypothetical protein
MERGHPCPPHVSSACVSKCVLLLWFYASANADATDMSAVR